MMAAERSAAKEKTAEATRSAYSLPARAVMNKEIKLRQERILSAVIMVGVRGVC